MLVTCSTGYQGDERLAAAAIEALRDEPVRVLVTLAGAHRAAKLPDAPNARVERLRSARARSSSAPAAVVCHAGMGIVQKALAARVPIVAVPFGRDQPEIARRVAQAGAGVAVPARKLTAARLRGAFDQAIALRPRLDQLAVALDAPGGPGRFADAAEALLANATRLTPEGGKP